MPIRWRLALLFAIAVLLSGAAGGFFFVHQLRQGLESNLDSVLRARAQSVATEIADTANVELPGGATGTLLKGSPSVTQIVTVDGRVLDTSDYGGGPSLLSTAQLRRAQRGPVVIDATVSLPASVPGDDTDAQHFRLLVTPTNRPGTLVVVGASRKTIDDAVGQSELWLLALGGPAVVFAGIAAYLIAGAALRPVERMRAQAAGFGVDTQPAELLVPGTRDELDRLAQTLNDLLGRLRTALEQERSFVADAGHELRTPLAILSGELELASRQRRSVTELRQTIHVAREETDRLVRLSEQLLVLAHADSGSLIARRETDVGSVLVASRDSALASRPDNGVRLELSVPSGLTAYVDPDRLRQAVDNLLVNALRYSPRGSAIEVTATQEGGSDDGTLTVSVRDHGPGFALEFLPHAFDRFRRADEARGRTGTSGGASGAGLGLAIVRSIVEAHGGSATAENCPDAGARVTLTFSPEGANSAQPD